MKLFGALLSGVGIFIAGASGLCSVSLLLMGVFQRGGGGFGDLLVIVLFFGGIQFAIGMGLIRKGRAMVANVIAETERSRSPQLVEPKVVPKCEATSETQSS